MKSSFWNGTMFGDRNVFVLSVTNSCRVPLWTQLKGSYSSNCLCLCDHIYGSVQSDLWFPAHGHEVWSLGGSPGQMSDCDVLQSEML